MHKPKCFLNCGRVKYYCHKSPSNYFVCEHCGVIFQDVLPSVKMMSEYAESQYRSGLYREYVEASSLKLETFKQRIGLIKKRKNDGLLLDIGCSSGFFIEVALQNGFDAYGFELSSNAIAMASENIRPRITQGDVNLLNRSIGQAFDVLVAFDIIEHTQDPLHFLRNIRDLLQPGGCLVLSTPNTGHYLRYLMRSRWPMLQPLQHTYLFSKKAIRRALELIGFHDIHIEDAHKVLSMDYLMGQIRVYNPLIYRAYRTTSFLMPRFVRERPFSINIGEILVLCNA